MGSSDIRQLSSTTYQQLVPNERRACWYNCAENCWLVFPVTLRERLPKQLKKYRNDFRRSSWDARVLRMADLVRCNNWQNPFVVPVLTDRERREMERERKPLLAIHCPKCGGRNLRRLCDS
jgi:hypothetical protein